MSNINLRIQHLIEGIGNPDNDIQIHSEKSLIKIGLPAVNALVEATKHENPQIRWRAAYSLGRIGDNRAFDAILDLVINPDSRDSVTRYEAFLALGYLGDPRAIPPLAEIMLTSEPGESAIGWASCVLVDFGEQAIDVLKKIILNGNPDAIQEASDALETINDRMIPSIQVDRDTKQEKI